MPMRDANEKRMTKFMERRILDNSPMEEGEALDFSDDDDSPKLFKKYKTIDHPEMNRRRLVDRPLCLRKTPSTSSSIKPNMSPHVIRSPSSDDEFTDNAKRHQIKKRSRSPPKDRMNPTPPSHSATSSTSVVYQSRISYTGYSSLQMLDSPEHSDVEEETTDRWQKAELLAALDGKKEALNSQSLEPESPPMPLKPFYLPSIQGCRSVEEFECLNRIEEGTYGVVYRARDKKMNEIVALKRLKMEKERDGFPITSLREINTLMKAQHENIVTVREIVVGSNMDKIYLVMDYVEHDLKSLMEVMNGPFSLGEVKCLLIQLLRAVNHMHDNWILHRDLKTSNLLLSHKGILKVGDFGLAREYGSPLKHYTEVVVTLWYRAPELLLGSKLYSTPIDMWSVGCIFAEFLLQRPLFPGKGELDELNLIFKDLGTPNERIWSGVHQLPGFKKCIFTEYPYNQLRRRFTERQITDLGFDLLNNFLTYDPVKRTTAERAMSHQFFQEKPRAIDPSMFPSWPAKSEGNFVKKKQASPKMPAQSQANRGEGNPPPPPLGGQRFYSHAGDHYASSLLAGGAAAGSAGSGNRQFLGRRTPTNLVAQEDSNFVLRF